MRSYGVYCALGLGGRQGGWRHALAYPALTHLSFSLLTLGLVLSSLLLVAPLALLLRLLLLILYNPFKLLLLLLLLECSQHHDMGKHYRIHHRPTHTHTRTHTRRCTALGWTQCSGTSPKHRNTETRRNHCTCSAASAH